ncbi:MAG: iron ABC transporter permease [Acidobacteria bacterium]|nr:iron ABC transporter permease [Acidobacteriota bacterium]
MKAFISAEDPKATDPFPGLLPPGEAAGDVGPSPLTAARLLLVCGLLLLALGLTIAVSLAMGSVKIPLVTVIEAVGARLAGHTERIEPSINAVLFSIRLPRILLAVIAGSALSVAGALLQAMLRNPLAEPYVLGISSGAAAGALMALIVAASFPLAQPAFAFLGALLTMLLVYSLSRQREGVSNERLILAGVILASFLWSAIAATITVVANQRLRHITFWLMGNLSGGGDGLIGIIALGTALAIAVAYLSARSLNLLMVGDEDARVLGVALERVKLVVFVVSSLLTGMIVSVCGMIPYVGLVVPHMVRLHGRSDNRYVIPVSAIFGGIFVLVADTLARTLLAPRELPVGAITALVGAPVFVYLLRRSG